MPDSMPGFHADFSLTEAFFMFLVIDSSPATPIEPCKACKTLMEVGPPPMADTADNNFDLIVTPLAPCRHNQEVTAWPQDFGISRIENCA
jgi:hypothetical protein